MAYKETAINAESMWGGDKTHHSAPERPGPS